MCSNETYNTGRILKNLFENSYLEWPEKRKCFITIDFHISLAVRRALGNHEGLKLNGTHQLLACASNCNIMGENIDTVQKNTKGLFIHQQEAGLEVNAEKTKYMFMSRYQKSGQKPNIKIGNR
jgi:hypothetical protein